MPTCQEGTWPQRINQGVVCGLPENGLIGLGLLIRKYCHTAKQRTE
jgi:hypothetical protein